MAVVAAPCSVTDKLPGADPSQNPLLCPVTMFYWAVLKWMCFRDFPSPRFQCGGRQWQEMEQICTVKEHTRHKQVCGTQNHHRYNTRLFIKQINILELLIHLKCFIKYTEAKSSCLETQNGPPGERSVYDLSCMILPKNTEKLYSQRNGQNL